MPEETSRRIAVLGAGPGGLAAALVLSRAGHSVALHSRTAERLEPMVAVGGGSIEGEGDEPDELIAIDTITTDVAAAVTGADIVLCCVPANGQEPLARAIAGHLKRGAVVMLMPGSAGTLAVGPIFIDAGLDLHTDVLLGESLTLPQSARYTAPSRVRLRLPSRNRVAAFPGVRSPELYEALEGIVRWKASPSVLDTGLNNVNFLIHPGPMLLNYAEIERRDNEFSLMNEGMTDGVLRCMDALDAEKMALCTTLGLPASDIDSLYTELGSGPQVYRVKGEPFNLKDRIWPRYIDEDTPYGTVMISSLAEQLGVATPISDSINTLLSMLEGVDFAGEGRTADALGLGGMSADQITTYVLNGPPRN